MNIQFYMTKLKYNSFYIILYNYESIKINNIIKIKKYT